MKGNNKSSHSRRNSRYRDWLREIYGSFDISSDGNKKVVGNKKKTAELIVYLNHHNQMYIYEQQFSISCVGPI